MSFSCSCGKVSQKSLSDVSKDLLCPGCGSKLSTQTRLENFMSLSTSDKERMWDLIYDELRKSPGTDREIAARLGFTDPNKVRPRRFELADQGKIIDHGKRPCNITGKTSTEWVIV